jgi:hypothetical protein
MSAYDGKPKEKGTAEPFDPDAHGPWANAWCMGSPMSSAMEKPKSQKPVQVKETKKSDWDRLTE